MVDLRALAERRFLEQADQIVGEALCFYVDGRALSLMKSIAEREQLQVVGSDLFFDLESIQHVRTLRGLGSDVNWLRY